MKAFKIENLNISYGNNKVINNMSLDIEDKKITAIIGPSGCGKTTFLMSLNKMIEDKKTSTSGNIFLYDKNINNMDKNDLRKNVGILFQNPTPFPISISENIKYALKYYGIKDNLVLNDLTKKALLSVGLYDEVKDSLNKSANKLSGGQQQRLCLARTLAINPKVILLDEPCSALDIKNTKIIEELLMELAKDYTIIIVTHNLAQARRISDNTMFILNGDLIEYNTTKNLFENPQDIRTKQYIDGIYG